MHFNDSDVDFSKFRCIPVPMVVLILAINSADPHEMQYYAAFHHDLHCSPKFPFRGFQYTND